MTKTGRLFLIPNTINEENQAGFLPVFSLEQVKHIRHFIFESEKAGRALVKKLAIHTPQSDLIISLWNEHSDKKTASALLGPALEGFDIGLASDAGIPCVADPGHEVVFAAHRKGIAVVPLPGTSSIFMALMASGIAGQHFAFSGYLPVDKQARIKRIREMEEISVRKGQTQLFMEAPYRNNHLFEDVLKTCLGQTRFGIAVNILAPGELIRTMAISEWKKEQAPDLHKKPCVFILGASQ